VGTGIASGFGPWLAGYIFDVSGSYQIAFWFVITMNLLSIIFVVMAVTVSKREQQRKLSN
jgi:cyanate permease